MSCQEDLISSQAPLPTGQAAWYVLQCKPRQHFRAEEHLTNQGFTCYQPLLHAEKIQQGKRREVVEPLFPGYLFIRLCRINDNWAPIRSTRGVTRMVGFTGSPQPVPDSVINALRQRMAAQPHVAPALQPGDPITVTTGAFADIEAIFSAYDGDERVVILLNLMHRQQQLMLPVGSIEKRERVCA